MLAVRTDAIGRAFADPVLDAQRAFRAILAAMAEPGTVHRLDAAAVEVPPGISPAALIALLTLVDQDTPLWLEGPDSDRVFAYLRFHTGAVRAATPAGARFAVLAGSDAAPLLAAFDPGDERYPDRSTTVLVEARSLGAGPSRRWSGPGIKGAREVAVDVARPGFWDEVATNAARYPLGVDILFAAGCEIVALPRSTAVTAVREAR
jgi:alpha-D-ribose 1-methylphosphonate 5-triphosphate synthase subunit PhnH